MEDRHRQTQLNHQESLTTDDFGFGFHGTERETKGPQLQVDGDLRPSPSLCFEWCGNDPSAGSPTETLLRLHLPLNDEV